MKYFTFTVSLLFLISIENSICFDFDSFDYKSMTANPYRVLGIAPWRSMKSIKKRYRELIKIYHPDKSHGNTQEQFQLIQKSYEEIKKERRENGEEEDSDVEVTFLSIAKQTIRQIFIIEIIFLVVYYITYFWYKLNQYLLKPAVVCVGVYAFVDRVIPHFFDDGFNEFFWVVVLSCVIVYQKQFLSWVWNKIIDKK